MTEPSIPVAPVDRFQMQWGLNGMVLVLGAPAVRVGAQGVTDEPNWFISAALSPVTVKQLRDLCDDVVKRWESAHGEIPVLAMPVRSSQDRDNVAQFGQRVRPSDPFSDSPV